MCVGHYITAASVKTAIVTIATNFYSYLIEHKRIKLLIGQVMSTGLISSMLGFFYTHTISEISNTNAIATVSPQLAQTSARAIMRESLATYQD